MGERAVIGVDGVTLTAGMGEDTSEDLVVAGAEEDAEDDGDTTAHRVLRGVMVADREAYADPRCSASCHEKKNSV
jgi:hypothetical protein